MDWFEVKNWLENHGHISSSWDCVAVGDDSFFAEDEMENTFISLFQRSNGHELIAFVGMMHPKCSVGGGTGRTIDSHEDVIAFLEDNLEDMYDELMRKVL